MPGPRKLEFPIVLIGRPPVLVGNTKGVLLERITVKCAWPCGVNRRNISVAHRQVLTALASPILEHSADG